MSDQPDPMSHIAGEMAGAMPEVTGPGGPAAPPPPPPAAAAAAATPEPDPAAQALGKDRLGRPFDPAKFLPEKDIIGRWKNRNAGRKAKNGNGNRPPAENRSVIAPDEPAGGKVDRFELAAETYLRAGYPMLDSAFGGTGEWFPDEDSEHTGIRDSLAHWLRARDSDDLPPGFAFALVALGYASKRMQRPNTLTRWRQYCGWLRARWGAWKDMRRQRRLPPPEGRS